MIRVSINGSDWVDVDSVEVSADDLPLVNGLGEEFRGSLRITHAQGTLCRAVVEEGKVLAYGHSTFAEVAQDVVNTCSQWEDDYE